jgi:hypothetical protein
MKYTTSCGGINGDYAVSLKKLNIFVDQIYKKRSLEGNSMPGE